jgi:hypothetical protein
MLLYVCTCVHVCVCVCDPGISILQRRCVRCGRVCRGPQRARACTMRMSGAQMELTTVRYKCHRSCTHACDLTGVAPWLPLAHGPVPFIQRRTCTHIHIHSHARPRAHHCRALAGAWPVGDAASIAAEMTSLDGRAPIPNALLLNW